MCACVSVREPAVMSPPTDPACVRERECVCVGVCIFACVCERVGCDAPPHRSCMCVRERGRVGLCVYVCVCVCA